jgi:type IV secretion system protein VirB10
MAMSMLLAQDKKESPDAAQTAARPERFDVVTGTRIPLNLINSISTKNAAEGDRVYLETAFPIVIGGKIVIPPGSYVAGTVTQVKRPGRVKGKGEIYLRFDSLTLPNGVTRDFRARISGLDGRSTEELDRKEGKVVSEGNKSGDARSVGETAVTGTWIGTVAGAAAGRPGMGAGVGAAAGAAAGLMGVMLTRGPDAILAKGTTIEMVLDRDLYFDVSELDFSGSGYMRRVSTDGGGPPAPSQRGSSGGLGRRVPGRFPFVN